MLQKQIEIIMIKHVTSPKENIKYLKEIEAIGDFLLSNIWPTQSDNVLVSPVSILD